MAPAPWNDISTPMNDGDRWRLWLLTAKMSVSSNPIASSAAPTPTLSWRRTGVRAMWARPAESSRRKRCSFGAGARLAETQCDEGGSRGKERPGVDQRDDGAAKCGVDPCARERCHEPQAFAHQLEGAVRVGKQLVGQHRLHHRRPRRAEDVPAETVERGHA